MTSLAVRLTGARRRRFRQPPPDDIIIMLAGALCGIAGQVLLLSIGLYCPWITLIGDAFFIHALVTFIVGWYTATSLDDPPGRDMVRRIMVSTIVGVNTIKVGAVATIVEVILRLAV